MSLVLALSSDWFMVLSKVVMIGQILLPKCLFDTNSKTNSVY